MSFRRLIPALLLAGAAAAMASGAPAATLAIGNGAEPGTLDPQKTSGAWETRITRSLFDRLIDYDVDGSLVPGLAESWRISDDGTVYTFHLRDARWSDGEPITANDAVFALRRLLAPATANHNANLYYAIHNARAVNTGKAEPATLGVSAPDDRTLVVHLDQPAAYFLQALAMSEAAPLPEHLIERAGTAWTEPGTLVSSGAFTLEAWRPQAFVRVARNPRFYAADSVALDGATFYPIDDAGAALNRFRSGELDIAYSGVPAAKFDWVKQHLGDALRVGPLVAEYFYMFNLRDGQPLADPRVREALNLAVRRDVITQQLLGMGQRSSYWYVPRATAGGTRGRMAFAEESPEARLQRAQALMREAGYGPEHPLPLTLRYNTLEDHKKIAVAVAAMWKPLGVEVDLVNSEAAVHYAAVAAGDFQVARYGMVATVDDPYDFLNAYADGGSAARSSGYHDADYDALVERSTQTLDPAARARLMTRAEQRLLDDYALLPLYDYVSAHLVAPGITGWQSTPTDVHPLRYIQIED
ncbi:peptide ABC transporter substrate-binding protein [Halomonas coralii]|uniref:peptide ABC transporter substrate-binding protein n=1 Tax=Modicisalibacter sp. R2A 31.J TaxID=2831898 RepID=UPI001CCB99F6|nr:peptide ABC transporter substrate-binding protein [Modicisalibacter sp. R2A 31.J]MBZ9558193.1 peptide ABC transporter substrate-binding protein [Modicisalibacter sp. R2A 31.J]